MSRSGIASCKGSILQCWKAAIFADGAVKAYWQSIVWHGHVFGKDGNEKGGR